VSAAKAGIARYLAFHNTLSPARSRRQALAALTMVVTMVRIVVMDPIAGPTRISEAVEVTTIQASEFKAKCLALMDEVARTGRSITVTKNGRPIAQLCPHRPPRAPSLIGLHKGQIEVEGDIVSALGSPRWDALK
jgi:prevent-host-death family protein